MGSPAGSARVSWTSLFQLLAARDIRSQDFAAVYSICSSLRYPSLEMLSLVLQGLVTLSQRPETVSGVQSRGATLAARSWGSG